MENFDTYDQLASLVDESGGVLSVKMLPLRDAHGVGRLGKHVRKNISKELSKRGLGHVPKTLPPGQHDTVRIYRMGQPIADLIQAAIEPGADQDHILRKTVSADAQETIERIRELVEA